ncbi:alginate biosynthesis transcriptional activator [Stutzerimonas stutzeri A1501]|jgi:plasmid stability protein|uniref:Alginate biosynthesis transcriptional activator n=2 Tax=Stutzerimonas stutzeri TaxID=316 RepID=A4VJC0_STUS1|nr:alginate biosynthesis transcriptional activator [Stutzerimonas stutzeri A1501]
MNPSNVFWCLTEQHVLLVVRPVTTPAIRQHAHLTNRLNMRPMKQAVYSSRTADKFVVRLPDGMRERIADVARNHHRSMNSEIIARLEQSLLQEGALDDDLSMRLDSPELSLHERELLQRFRQLTHRQQNALIALIAQDAELAKEDS